MCLMNIDLQHDDLERNIMTLIGTLGREIVWFVPSPFWLIVVMKLRVSVVFSSIRLSIDYQSPENTTKTRNLIRTINQNGPQNDVKIIY